MAIRPRVLAGCVLFCNLFPPTAPALLILGTAFPAAAADPAVESKSPVVTFNIVAVDAKGAPVRDLRATDLRIWDDGKRMPAAFCRTFQTAEPLAARLGPREYSNRPTRGVRQTTVVLFDLLNEDLAERGYGWNELGRTFRKLESGQSFYVYLLTREGTAYPIHGLSPGEIQPEDDAVWVERLPGLLDHAMQATGRQRPQDFRVNVDSRVRQTVAVLQDLGAELGSQPGRKSLVWVSHGVPLAATALDGKLRDYTPWIQDLGTSFARTGIAVYAVDQSDHSTTRIASTDTLEELAHLTGGQVFVKSIEDAIQQAVSDGPATYEVGYLPPLDRWDNKFHKLRVTTEVKGVRVRAMSGYFGDPREVNPGQRFALATLGPADDSGIGIRAALSPSQRVEGWTHFQIRVNPADLQLTSGESATGEIRVTFAYYTTEWQQSTSEAIPAQVRLTSENRESMLRDGFDLSFDRGIPAGVRKLRIVVRDAHSGAVGSLTIPLEPPSGQ